MSGTRYAKTSNTPQADVYQLIASSDGITAREIASRLGIDRKSVNQLLYNNPFVHDLCYHDDNYLWHCLIQQRFPHVGLFEYAGWYGTVHEFMSLDEESWLDELRVGCKRIGRNLNDTRGLIHSFCDTRETMRQLFSDLSACKVACDEWEVVFELRIKTGKWVRIYADVVLISPSCAFSLEFKMKSEAPQSEVDQAAKYIPYLQVVLGSHVPVFPALVLTQSCDRFEMLSANNGLLVALCSGDAMLNIINEPLQFLK
ncbi:hypothetical protein AALA21_05660 [Eggerthellaceae bacterium 3-80]|nr:helix-turn-helix domain containing protein [bacterium D16-34]